MANIYSKKQSTVTGFLKNSLLCMILGVVLIFILLLLCSFILLKIDKYEALYPILAIALQCITAFVSGKLLGKIYGRSLLIVGLSEGALICIAFLLLSIVFFTNETNYNSLFSSIPYIVSSATLGSVTTGRKIK